jgi:hypothetical protein
MKRYYSLFVLTVALGLTACGGDDDNSPSYKFKDQNAQGKINNTAFAYADGFADVDDEEINVTLTLEQSGDICSNMPEGNTVFFTVDNELKVSKLYFNLGTFEGQTVTLFQDEGTLNVIATKGAVEILSVTETEVTGRLDARADSDSFINGNFTVQRCPQ